MTKTEAPALSPAECADRIADLDARIVLLDEEAKPLRRQLGNIDSTRSKLALERTTLADRLRTINEKPRVSDHAVVRYLERKYSFDFEAIRAEMLTPAVIGAIKGGATGVKLDGGTLKISGRTITTYIGG